MLGRCPAGPRAAGPHHGGIFSRGVNSERNFARWTQGLCHFGVRVLLGVLSALADSWGRLMTRFERSEASN